jgi:hypothetical protein
MEFILELIPPRLFGFIIAVLFIVGGVYAWQQGSAERALFDTAVGPGSRAYNAAGIKPSAPNPRRASTTMIRVRSMSITWY